MSDVIEQLIKKNYSSLTMSQKKVAEYILRNPEEVAFLSSKALGNKVGCSEATVVRLANALTISGFSEMKLILMNWLQKRLVPSEKLRRTKIKHSGDIYKVIFENSVKNILKIAEDIPTSKLQMVVDALDNAKRIFVLGLRRSHSIAFLLYYNLNRMLGNATLIDTLYGLQYDYISNIVNRDVFITISFFRYAKATLEITKFAKENKALIIAITDHPLSPIGKLADICLCVEPPSEFFFGSNASAIVLIECIIGGLSIKRKAKYAKALKDFENILGKANVWIS